MTEAANTPRTSDPYTARGLIDFLDAAVEKGWFNVGTAKALRTASTKILSVEAGWEDLDIRSLDVDGMFERFRNLKRNDYSDDSMRIYKSRMSQAIKMHKARLEDDPAWRTYGPSTRNGTSNGAAGKKPSTRKAAAATSDQGSTEAASAVGGEAAALPAVPATAPSRALLMQFPYPLRDDLDVHLSLPRDLTKSEAERLCRFIATLAREAPLAITAGNGE